MWIKKSWQIIGLGTLSVGVASLLGCPRISNAGMPRLQTDVIPVVQPQPTETAIADYPPQSAAFEVCGELADWQRPSLSEQMAMLAENPRYGDAIATEPLKSLFEKFWNESVITFTTYGLSARTEPVNLSGVWTGIDAMNDCYGNERVEAINAGSRAEVWLIGYRVESVTWTGSEYQVEVIPRAAGLQFVQFERFEDNMPLPVVVDLSTGDTVAVASGDW